MIIEKRIEKTMLLIAKKHKKITLISCFVLVGLFFYACQPTIYQKTTQTSLALDSSYAQHAQTEAIITPYKVALEKEMNEVLVVSAEEFPKEKGKPETKLGNLVADLAYSKGITLYNTKHEQNIHMCLLNFGGLRTSLPKGKITKGKIFELMPFENELVVVTISDEKLKELYLYLGKNPQPISSFFKLSYNEKGYEIYFDTEADAYPEDGNIKPVVNYGNKILTSDYLANGGDNMTFFLNPINYEKVGIKLRDAIIQYCIEQRKQGKQLTSNLDGRITYE